MSRGVVNNTAQNGEAVVRRRDQSTGHLPTFPPVYIVAGGPRTIASHMQLRVTGDHKQYPLSRCAVASCGRRRCCKTTGGTMLPNYSERHELLWRGEPPHTEQLCWHDCRHTAKCLQGRGGAGDQMRGHSCRRWQEVAGGGSSRDVFGK